jgi:segregation and condensation protein A
VVSEEYRVRLEAFEGPLDLLLFLIRKNEVDVHDIPIAAITDQYLGMIAELRTQHAAHLDIDAAGEFLVMAATLMEIKSRMLLPAAKTQVHAEGQSDAPAEDPRAELVRQLVEYKRYRDAADTLERRADEWQRRYPSGRAHLDNDALDAALEQHAAAMELEELNVLDLVEAFRKVQETVNFDRLGDHQITYDDTPIELHAQDILLRLTEQRVHPSAEPGEMEFRQLFAQKTRSEMVGMFLALLELVRNRKVRVRQDHTPEGRVEGAIYISAREEETDQAGTDQAGLDQAGAAGGENPAPQH